MTNPEKKNYALGIGTEHERALHLPTDLSARFDEWFKVIDEIERRAESALIQPHQRAPYQALMPLIAAVRIVWAYTSEETQRLQAEIEDLRTRLALLAEDPGDSDPQEVPF